MYLVTGAAGFIGSHLCKRLLGSGCDVTGVDNFDPFYDVRIKKANLESLCALEGFRFIEADIRDTDAMDRILRDPVPDRVIHLAARPGVRPSIQDPLLYEEVNVRGTMNLLETARRVGVGGFVFASSSSVYGERKQGPFKETDSVDHPVSPYAATKKMGELACYTYHHLFDLPTTCLRFFTVYGPGQRPEMAIHKFARLMHAGEPIPVYGDGGSQRDYTYIDDIIDGVVGAASRSQGYEIYNLGESRVTRLDELVRLLEEAMGVRARIERLPLQPGDVPVTFADVGKAIRDLGYAPRTTMEEGIGRFVEWFRREGVRYV